MIQKQLAAYEQGTHIGLADTQTWKEQYDKLFRTKAYNGFHFYAVAFDGIMPIVGSGAFYPEVDFDGEELQHLGREGAVYENIAINVTSLENKTVLVAGWLGSDDGPAHRFAESLRRAVGSEGTEAVVRLCFEHLENIYLRPSWWNSLGSKKNLLLQRALSGTMSKARHIKSLISDRYKFVPPLAVYREYGSSI